MVRKMSRFMILELPPERTGAPCMYICTSGCAFEKALIQWLMCRMSRSPEWESNDWKPGDMNINATVESGEKRCPSTSVKPALAEISGSRQLRRFSGSVETICVSVPVSSDMIIS